ncbi:MAG: MBL fold metallo-hydrolase, partial [Paludibacteraceae bacterium]|nr:MBL fold metallo-hydrolase [Paludibacteraceae bacterium]
CSNPYEQEALLRYIQMENLTVKAIIATHGHLDHLWGAAWVCEQWHLPVLMHAADRQMAEAMQDQYNLFGVQRTAEPFPIASLRAAEKSFRPDFEIIETPGHTPGSVCLYWSKEKVLISGDTLFHMGYGRTDLPGGDIGQLIDSLGRLFTLPPDVRVYPGHGDSTTIGAEAR